MTISEELIKNGTNEEKNNRIEKIENFINSQTFIKPKYLKYLKRELYLLKEVKEK